MRVVIPSLGYGDMLRVTLPAWRALLPDARFTVVTAADDMETQTVAAESGPGVRLRVTDIWRRRGALLNKGGALDLSFGFGAGRPPGHGEPCLSIDADVYPFGRLPERLDLRTIYGCPRYECASPGELAAHVSGVRPLESFPLILPRVRGRDAWLDPSPAVATIADAAQRCLGYFQLFRYFPGLSFGWSRTAGKCDIRFRNQFQRRSVTAGFYVLHLGSSTRANWRGRVVARWE